MFNQPATAGLTSQPRKGIGARVAGGLSRFGAALRSAVTGSLRRAPSGSDSRTAANAGHPPAAGPARAPRQPGRARKPKLARLFGRGAALAAIPPQSHEHPDLQFTAEAFPDLSPEALAFFNTPVGQCDPDMLAVVLEALAGFIVRSLPPQEGMQDVRDVFLALRSRMAAATGEAGQAPPAAPPEVAAAPADAAADATIEQSAGSPGVPGPALRQDPAAPAAEGTVVAHDAAVAHDADAAASAALDQPAIALDQLAIGPAGPPPAGALLSGTRAEHARAPDRGRVPPRHTRHWPVRGRPRFATRSRAVPRRNIPLRNRYVIRTLPRPVRLRCYAACAGPPARLRRA